MDKQIKNIYYDTLYKIVYVILDDDTMYTFRPSSENESSILHELDIIVHNNMYKGNLRLKDIGIYYWQKPNKCEHVGSDINFEDSVTFDGNKQFMKIL